jgi:hypothetical protein
LHNFLLKPEMLSNVGFATRVEFLRYPAGPGNPVGQCPVLGGHFPGRCSTGSLQTCPLKRTVPILNLPNIIFHNKSTFFHALQP